MTYPVTTEIDSERCIGCGSCVDVCPSDTLALHDERAVVVGNESLNCGHCQAVCPANAVTVRALDPESSRYDTFDADDRWLPFGQPDTAQLVRLMASRRSCRNYREAPVARDVLVDLAKIGATAPSATNSQGWRFSFLPDREAVLAFAERIGAFFRILNKIVEPEIVGKVAKLLGHPEVEAYRRDYRDRIEEGLDEWAMEGRERLFHGATAAILVSSLPGASMGKDDALLATQNILLGAHAMGLGSCLIGFAVHAVKSDPRIPRWLGLSRGEKVHSVIGLGYPAEVYEKAAGRLPLPIRFIER